MAVKDDPKAVVDQSAHAVQVTFDEIHEKGFQGDVVDETPREHYTVAGVTAGKPTPETTQFEKK